MAQSPLQDPPYLIVYVDQGHSVIGTSMDHPMLGEQGVSGTRAAESREGPSPLLSMTETQNLHLVSRNFSSWECSGPGSGCYCCILAAKVCSSIKQFVSSVGFLFCPAEQL